MKLTLDGITIEVSEADANFYLRCGYKKVNEMPLKLKADKKSGFTDTHQDKSIEAEKEGEA